MKPRWIKATGLTLVLAVAAFWYWSPLLTIHQMREAARAGDADAFSTHVDYPKLRANLKVQFSASFTQQDSDTSQPQSGWAKAGASLGRMLGTAMVDGLVETFVRPEVVMRAMQQGQLMPKTGAPSHPTPEGQGGSGRPDGTASTTQKPQATWWTEHQGVNTFILHVRGEGQPEDRDVGLLFERRGLFSWQLADLRLPAGAGGVR